MSDKVESVVDGDEVPAGGSSGFLGVVVPEQWAELELDPDLRDGSIDHLISQIVSVSDLGENQAIIKAELVAYCRSASARCYDQGGLAAFIFSDVMDEEPFLLSASMIVSYHLSDSQQSIDGLVTELKEIGGVRSVDSIRIDGRPVVRTRAVHLELAPGTDEEIELAFARYFLPVSSGGVLIVSFSTPNVPLEAEFVELFDEIVSTIEFNPGTASAELPQTQ